MNIKEQALYFSLAGYAHDIYKNKDMSCDGITYRIAKEINKESKKSRKIITSEQAHKIVDVLKSWEKEFTEEPTSPSILLILTLNYLLNECEHHRTKLLYGQWRSDVNRLFNEIEHSEYKNHLYKHMDLIDKFI